MRSDMHKVLCERPRGGRSWILKFPRPQVPFDQLPPCEGMKRPHDKRKMFGEHLGPLKRWLRSQLGRPWNDVFSEACAVIKPDSVVRNHIKFHLLEFVCRNTFMREGEVWCYGGVWTMQEMPISAAARRGQRFYVHPETLRLCEAPSPPRRRRHDAVAEFRRATQRWLGSSTLLRQLDGCWFECRMKVFPPQFAKGDKPWRFDAAERRLINRSDADHIYGQRVFCPFKRQLSKRELRRFGLVNSSGSPSHSSANFRTNVTKRLEACARCACSRPPITSNHQPSPTSTSTTTLKGPMKRKRIKPTKRAKAVKAQSKLVIKLAYWDNFIDEAYELETLLAKKPKQLQIEFVGSGRIPPDTALLMRSIIQKRPGATRIVTNARSSLQGATVLVWLLGDQRHIREDARLQFEPAGPYVPDDAPVAWKDPILFSGHQIAEEDYIRVLHAINEFLPVEELAGRPIEISILKEFGLVDRDKMNAFLAGAFRKGNEPFPKGRLGKDELAAQKT